VAAGGDLNINGKTGGIGAASSTYAGMIETSLFIGTGADSMLGFGANPPNSPGVGGGNANGVDGIGYGSGGSGAYNTADPGNPANGGAGKSGIVIVTEYYA
jgi:hypothetical protein